MPRSSWWKCLCFVVSLRWLLVWCHNHFPASPFSHFLRRLPLSTHSNLFPFMEDFHYCLHPCCWQSIRVFTWHKKLSLLLLVPFAFAMTTLFLLPASSLRLFIIITPCRVLPSPLLSFCFFAKSFWEENDEDKEHWWEWERLRLYWSRNITYYCHGAQSLSVAKMKKTFSQQINPFDVIWDGRRDGVHWNFQFVLEALNVKFI